MIILDTSFYRKLVVAVNTKVPLINGKYSQAINFDNAATTPPFTTGLAGVIKSLYLYASVHRAFGYKSQFRSEEHTSELQSRQYIERRLLFEKKEQRAQAT